MFADTAFPPEPFSRREAFLDLVQRAAIEEKVIPVNGGTITLKRGQVYASVRFLAKRWEWSKSKVERFIKDLQSWGFVGQRATQKWDTLRDTNEDTLTSVISIVNYDAFQGVWDTSRDTNEDAKRDTNEDKYNKENKEIKKEQKKTSNDVKEKKKYSEDVERIYTLYPTKCPTKGRVIKKGDMCKRLIVGLLKTYSEDELTRLINNYVNACKNQGLWMMDFNTFLHQRPEYADDNDLFQQPTPPPAPKKEPMCKVTISSGGFGF